LKGGGKNFCKKGQKNKKIGKEGERLTGGDITRGRPGGKGRNFLKWEPPRPKTLQKYQIEGDNFTAVLKKKNTE